MYGLSPQLRPLNVPEDITTNDRYKGAYLNRFLSSTFTPGSVYKTVTLAAALEEIPDLADRTWTCSGSVQMGTRPSSAPAPTGSRTSPPPSPTAATWPSPRSPRSWGRALWRSTRSRRA
ncbi:MAG: penicillin-binding transpeptidase domain-containing protein [Dysosmobacter welbionis]